jgi:thymidylate synthase
MERVPGRHSRNPMTGIRYPYGDLDDVVSLLAREPYTRQAYLPVWFPEDTGAVHGERVPCTLGYHFILRDNQLHTFYPLRSCDFLRHFRNDVYFAVRLTQWVRDQVLMTCPKSNEVYWTGVTPGNLTMQIVSLHIFEGDMPYMRQHFQEVDEWSAM